MGLNNWVRLAVKSEWLEVLSVVRIYPVDRSMENCNKGITLYKRYVKSSTLENDVASTLRPSWELSLVISRSYMYRMYTSYSSNNTTVVIMIQLIA